MEHFEAMRYKGTQKTVREAIRVLSDKPRGKEIRGTVKAQSILLNVMGLLRRKTENFNG